MTAAELKREVLVRHLETWAPAALHRARRAIYVHGYADAHDGTLALAALGVFGDQSDLVRGRELSMLAVGDDLSTLAGRLTASGAAAVLMVQAVSGGTDERLGIALEGTGAGRLPLLGFLDATAVGRPPARATVAALAAGKPAEVLLVLPA